MKCTVCGGDLVETRYGGKIAYECDSCHGHTVTYPAFRSICGSKEFANALWAQAKFSCSTVGIQCPGCGQWMRKVNVRENAIHLELDICTRCQQIWFDPQELEQVPQQTQTSPVVPAVNRTSSGTTSHDREVEDAQVDKCNPLQTVAAVLGFPVELKAPAKERHPWLTWGIAALCIWLFFLTTLGDAMQVIRTWGYIPAEWGRHGGATIFTSMFLHGGWLHLLGNLYFLFIFGDNVEDMLGHAKYAIMLLCSGLCATLTHTLFDPGSTIPCVGASGFISGIIACYAVCFPHVRLRYLLRFGLFFRWVTLPAWGAFLIWFLLQLAMGYFSDKQAGGTAYMAHVGGFIPGLFYAIIYRIHAHFQCKKAERMFLSRKKTSSLFVEK